MRDFFKHLKMNFSEVFAGYFGKYRVQDKTLKVF